MNKIFTIFIFSFAYFSAAGQDTTYLDIDFDKTNSWANSKYYKLIERDQFDSNRVVQRVFYITGEKLKIDSFSDYTKLILDGRSQQWSKNGQLIKSIDYVNNKFMGKLLTYWENGKRKRIEVYNNDSLISSKCFNKKGKKIEYFPYIIDAEFPGGLSAMNNFFSSNLIYPDRALNKNIQGKVQVEFRITKSGEVYQIKIKESPREDFGREAIRVVSMMPKWIPAKIDGEPVVMYFTLPISFTLE